MNSSRRRMWATARALGIPCLPRRKNPDKGSCPWNGTSLYGKVHEPDSEHSSDHWHELGHALISPDKGWKLAGWGQGQIYDGTEGGPLLEDAGLEQEASALGIWCQMVLGRDEEGARSHSGEHGWAWAEGEPSTHYDSVPESWVRELTEIKGSRRERARLRLSAAGLKIPWPIQASLQRLVLAHPPFAPRTFP